MNHISGYKRIQYEMTAADKRAAQHAIYHHRVNMLTLKLGLCVFVLPVASVIAYCLMAA